MSDQQRPSGEVPADENVNATVNVQAQIDRFKAVRETIGRLMNLERSACSLMTLAGWPHSQKRYIALGDLYASIDIGLVNCGVESISPLQMMLVVVWDDRIDDQREIEEQAKEAAKSGNPAAILRFYRRALRRVIRIQEAAVEVCEKYAAMNPGSEQPGSVFDPAVRRKDVEKLRAKEAEIVAALKKAVDSSDDSEGESDLD